MKIRAHLVLLVCAALLPALIFFAGLTAWFWAQQRAAFEARYLDRVRALSIAIDTEIHASMRVLNALTPAPELVLSGLEQSPAQLQQFSDRARRVLSSQPSWASFALTDPVGKNVLTLNNEDAVDVPIDEAMVGRVIAIRQPAMSGLLKGQTRKYAVQIAIPALRGSEITHVLIVSIHQKVWLDLLARFPVVPNATITLNDQEGLIIARTLDNERWMGKRSLPAFFNRTLEA